MYFDCHTHTYFSQDASREKSPEASCRYAYEKGLLGLAFTEHADLRVDEINHCSEKISKESLIIASLKEQYKGKMKVLMGAELADVPYCPDILKKITDICNYDILLASVHLIEYENRLMEMAVTDFSNTSYKEINKIINIYYEDMRKTVYTRDFNVLCHLTYPLRYFNKKYGKNITLDSVANLLDDILKTAIDKNIALEINTSKASPDDPDFCPDESFVKLYKSMGGTLFTLGSDSHVIGTEANMFEEACRMLKKQGIDKCCYFEEGKPHFYSI